MTIFEQQKSTVNR